MRGLLRWAFPRASALALILGGCGPQDQAPDALGPSTAVTGPATLDDSLRSLLLAQQFTGRVAATLSVRLGRPVDRRVADLGRLLWFDPIMGLNGDNTCGGCHSPTNGFGDTQPIAIGIENNRVVGPDRRGPRNQRRSPMVINSAFYPTLMWNSRFFARSGDPFSNAQGFVFPPPEGESLSDQPHLLVAQAFIPPTERVEAAGFTFPGDNYDIRREVVRRLQANAEYRRLFARAFDDLRSGAPLRYDHVARAIAEFEFTLVFADAPIDRFARGQRGAMTDEEKRGAVLFFGRAGCVRCHAVSGTSNEMFSDFTQHVLAVPQVVPRGSNIVFDGAGANEDFGLAQVTGNAADRYLFRTSPLRNLALQPAFMHDGAFLSLEAAVRHHLDPVRSARSYRPTGLPPDLQGPPGPGEAMLSALDPLVRNSPHLDEAELADLLAFLREGLLDRGAAPERLRHLIPPRLPSGLAPLQFQFR
jgi:cytochrome c peroxidase